METPSPFSLSMCRLFPHPSPPVWGWYSHYVGRGMPPGGVGTVTVSRFFSSCASQRFVELSSFRQLEKVLSLSWSGKHCRNASRALTQTVYFIRVTKRFHPCKGLLIIYCRVRFFEHKTCLLPKSVKTNCCGIDFNSANHCKNAINNMCKFYLSMFLTLTLR